MGWLDGQVALITGGGSGIGRAVVERFVEEGARVGVLERVSERAEQLRVNFPREVVALQGDVTLLADYKRAVEATVGAFGRLDIFVGNAGLFDNFLDLAGFPEDSLSDAFDELFAVNVKGYVLGAKAALPELVKSQGCMVFTASVASFNAAGGGPLYTASKHAVLESIRQLASELAPGVRVNGVAPGGTMTDLRGLATLDSADRSHFGNPGMEDRMRASIPLRMALQPSDHVGAYVYLASRANAGGITGVVIPTDGGTLIRQTRGSQPESR